LHRNAQKRATHSQLAVVKLLIVLNLSFANPIIDDDVLSGPRVALLRLEVVSAGNWRRALGLGLRRHLARIMHHGWRAWIKPLI